ncbi:MAG: 2-hydroxyhepta-2,4-diene-1,7-dioate isomerase [Gemmataceae bacterium]
MQLCKVQWPGGGIRIGIVEDDHVRFLDLEDYVGVQALSDILHADHPATMAREFIDDRSPAWPVADLLLLPPIDRQEIWAAGVTYPLSVQARHQESAGAGAFYQAVARSQRPELFFKATPHRVVGHGARIRIRRDSRWSVPEPEVALVISPRMKIVGYTLANDVTARDLEAENPLYLPQAKIYDGCCALGPYVTLAEAILQPRDIMVRLTVERRGERVFEGQTRVADMTRSLEDLVAWLARDNTFPHGVVLLTGTGIVPPDDFRLQPGDIVSVSGTGLGRLTNIVEQAAG